MLSAFGGAAGGADQAAFLVDEGFLTAVGASLTAGFGTVGQIFLQSAFDTHLPSVDGLGIEFETADEFQNLVDRHAVAKDAGDEFGVVPVFGIEFVGKAFDGCLITTLVYKLEVVAFVAFFVDGLDNLAVSD